MGYSFWLQVKNKEIGLDIGWGSMFASLLRDYIGEPKYTLGGGAYYLDSGDVEGLKTLARKQRKGSKEPPFDWSDDIKSSTDKIIAQIEKDGLTILKYSV